MSYHGKVIGEFVCDRITKYPYKWYGWHISDLKIYDEPKELSKFIKVFSDGAPCCELRQTQINNWCYVEEYDD